MKHTFNGIRSVLLIILYIGISIVVTFPAISTITTKLIGDGWDNYEFYSFQYIVYNNLAQGLYPFAHTDIFRFPGGIDFGTSFDGVLPVMLGAVLIPLLGQILAFNVTILVIMTINGICSHLLFKWISKSDTVALLGSIIYGYSTYTLARGASHANLLGISGFPLTIYALLRLRTSNQRFIDFSLFFLGLSLIAFSSLQYALIAVVFFSISLIVLWIVDRPIIHEYASLFRTHQQLIFANAIVFGGIVFFFLYPYFFAFINGTLEVSSRTGIIEEFQPDILNFFIPNPYLQTFFSWLFYHNTASIEQVFFIGYVEIVLLFLFFFKQKNIRKSLALILSLWIFFFLATGIGYTFLVHIFPFSGISEPGRFFIVFYLCITMAIMLVIKQSNMLQSSMIIFLLIGLVGMERVGFSYPVSDLPGGEFTTVVSRQPGKAVMDIPVDPYNPLYNVLPSAYNKSIINGYIHWTGDTKKARSFLDFPEIARFRCYPDTTDMSMIQSFISPEEEGITNTRLLHILKTYDIQTIVVHMDRKYYDPVCQDMKKRTNIFLPNMHTAISSGLDTVNMFESHPPNVSYFYHEIYFPFDGEFIFDGMLIAPHDLLPIEAIYEGQTLSFFATDWESTQYGMSWKPKEPVSLQVKGGTTMKLTSPRITHGTGWFTFWYRYSAINQTAKKPRLEEIFRNEDKIIYQIN